VRASLAHVQPGQAHGAHRLAVEIAVERDELELARGGPAEAQPASTAVVPES